MSQSYHIMTTRKASKEHRCYECKGIIRRGEIYEIESGIDDGPFAYKMCAQCRVMFDDANRRCWQNDGEGLPFGELHQDVFESRDVDLMAAYIRNKLRRCAEVRAWMWVRWREAREAVVA